MPLNRAVFLDRDGVLNALVCRPAEGLWDSPYTLDELRILPGAAEAVKRINELGLLAVIVSNQPGVAKGKCTPDFLQLVDCRLQEELARDGARLDAVYYCFHHPEGVVAPYGKTCGCRKPKPGLLVQAARDHRLDLRASYLVGDRGIDLEAGQAVGCRTILVETPATGAHADLVSILPGGVVQNVLQAIEQIEREEAGRGDLP